MFTVPLTITFTFPSTLSIAVAPGSIKLVPESIVSGLSPFNVIVGAIVSEWDVVFVGNITLTTLVTVDLLPELSVAV